MLENLDGLMWLLVFLGPLLLLQQRLHAEIQGFFFLLTRRKDIAIGLFSLLFLPGVLLHEVSHWIIARLLGVKTSNFSILPRPMPGGRLQLGYVETTKTDVLRDAFIGAAPLLAGGAFVAYAGQKHLGFDLIQASLLSGDLKLSWQLFALVPDQPDFWLWFYLTFTVCSTMLPSSSDRRAWLPVGLIICTLVLLALLVGAGPWLVANLGPWVNRLFFALATVFGISVVLHFLLWIPVLGLRLLFERVSGYKLGV